MENNIYLEHLTLEGYDLNKKFDASVFDERRIREIREVIRKYFRKRGSGNTEFPASEMAVDMSAFLGGDRRHDGAVRGDVTRGEMIYAMIQEGYASIRTHQDDANFNVITVSVRAFVLEAHRDIEPRAMCNPLRTLEHLHAVEPGHREWYYVEWPDEYNTFIRRTGGFENYLTDAEREQGSIATAAEEEKQPAEQPETQAVRMPKKRLSWEERQTCLISLAYLFASLMMMLSVIILPGRLRHHDRHPGVSYVAEPVKEYRADCSESETDTLASDKCYGWAGSDSIEEWSRQVEEIPDDLRLEEDQSLTSTSVMLLVLELLRGLSDRDFAIFISAQFLLLVGLFVFIFLFKRMRPRRTPHREKKVRKEVRGDDAEALRYDALLHAMSGGNSIIYGDAEYLSNVRTLLDCVCPADDVQVLYFNPADVRHSSPLPVLNSTGVRSYQEAYALADSLMKALRPYANSDVARNEFFYTSTIHMLAEVIYELGSRIPRDDLSFAHVVAMSMKGSKRLSDFFRWMPGSWDKMQFVCEAGDCRAMDQFVGQTSDLQLTLARFYDMEVIEAFRPVRLDGNKRTVILVENSDEVMLRLYRPLLDVLAEGIWNRMHKPMAVPETCDFSRVRVHSSNGRKARFDGVYRGAREPLAGEGDPLFSYRFHVSEDLDRVISDLHVDEPEAVCQVRGTRLTRHDGDDGFVIPELFDE